MFTSNNSKTLNSATSINVVTDAARGLPWVDYVTHSLSACRTFKRFVRVIAFLCSRLYFCLLPPSHWAWHCLFISLYAEEKIAEAANKVLHPYPTLPLFYSLILSFISCSQQGYTLFIINGVRKFEYDKPNIFKGSRERDARASIHFYLLR